MATTSTILEFLNQFPTLTCTSPPEYLIELSDGVILFEALAEISLDHFDPTRIARNLGENWALKQTNLRKLVRNLEEFYRDELSKKLELVEVGLDIASIAKADEDMEENIRVLFQFVAAAAVQCEDRGVFVGRIMNMSTEGQMEMKEMIESALSKLENFSGEDHEIMENKSEEQENEISFQDENEREKENLLRMELEEARAVIEKLQLAQSHVSNDNQEEELKAANEKLRLFAEDLQERLQDRETELTETENELSKAKRTVEGLTAEVGALTESKKVLEDEMSVAQSQVGQLRKAEASVLTYRKKLEDAALTNQQIQDLEDQSALYLRQIMDLENNVKTIPTLQRKITDLTSKLLTLEKSKEESVGNAEQFTEDMQNLRDQLSRSENSKKILEDELLRVKHDLEEATAAQEESAKQTSASNSAGQDFGLGSIGVTSQNLAEMREKVMRLEHENKALKTQINTSQNNESSSEAASAEINAYKATIKALEADIIERNAIVKKLSGDKEKLEAYTKKTLHKFQEKYLVALQECKAKLRDKHDKIEALESRQAAERSAQKREERLLSGVMYELGLAIMQNRLTNK